APPAAPPPAAEPATPAAGRAAVAEERRAPERPAAGAEGRVKASPLARRIAEEHDVDLARIAGSGPGGRVVREDVEAFLKRGQPAPAAAPAGVAGAGGAAVAPAATPAPAAATRMVPVSRMRAAIGRRMTESKTSVPHIYISAEVDMTEALRWRKQLNEAAAAEGYKVTVNDLVIKAAAQALTKFPNLNASFMGDQIALHGDVHISIAVALPDGLIAPVVRNADQKSIGRIAREAADLVARTREGKIHPDEFSGGTFTVSNLGPYNVETFISIITPPQAAALAVGSASQKAVVVDGAVAIRDRMNITLSADHRVTDGAESAQYVNEVRRLLEHPLSLLM
ncbi:MAG TPA: dihydrolipoamide acetyltransferase family protein, partial [Thermomicrobiales bacterium]|nr:dihydrolipoamide acetyltransferase family protein [Thermomicrobiales bacterium]